MVSKNEINFIVSLQKKKIRDEQRLFVIEGDKLVKEYLSARVRIKQLVAKPEFLNSLPLFLKKGIEEIIPASYEELKKISTLKTPHNALAVVEMPENAPDLSDLKKGLTVALDCVQDPGNLGTIIRAAAWFGLINIYCSPDCVDVYNPKVIQASMGATLQVKVFYTSLKEILAKAIAMNLPVYGAVLDGESIYSSRLADRGIILLGNESKGISDELLQVVTDKIAIPRLADSTPGIDSLNVSMAASVIFSEFTRSRGRQL
ncbi:MAG: RNA methyltransferase [Bacteroidales bacterium]|nr:RNA methyltransferase [Bacteroidales bacterium]